MYLDPILMTPYLYLSHRSGKDFVDFLTDFSSIFHCARDSLLRSHRSSAFLSVPPWSNRTSRFFQQLIAFCFQGSATSSLQIHFCGLKCWKESQNTEELSSLINGVKFTHSPTSFFSVPNRIANHLKCLMRQKPLLRWWMVILSP